MRLLFIVSEDWYFVSHRLEFAKYMISQGWQVGIACRVREHGDIIKDAGVELLEVPFHRESASFFDFLKDASNLRKAVKAYSPSIIQCVAVRSILSGWLATLFMPKLVTFYAVTGLGSLFSAELKTLRLKFVRRMVALALKFIFHRSRSYVIVQNKDDHATFLRQRWSFEQNTLLIRGAGMPVPEAAPLPEPNHGLPVLIFVGRLLDDKGIRELLEAVRVLNQERTVCCLRIVGHIDSCNPNAISVSDVEDWKVCDYVEFLGKRSDIIDLMSDSNLVVMPSYREGLPKVLLEAGIAGRAVITCDTQGCREVVKDGLNGLLVPVKDAYSLADAIRKLIENEGLRHELAQNHYARVSEKFSAKVIYHQMKELFEQVAKRYELEN